MLMKKLNTSKTKSSETEIPKLPPRPLNSLKSSESPTPPVTSDTYMGTHSQPNGSGTWLE